MAKTQKKALPVKGSTPVEQPVVTNVAKKTLEVKGIKVDVIGNELSFIKDGKQVTLQRKFGESDYRIVFHFLKRKTDRVTGPKGTGKHTVGNFSYQVDGSNVVIYNKANVEIARLENLNLTDKPVQYIRNLVINKLMSVLE